MTKDELKAVLASDENRRAGLAIQLIANGAAPDKLVPLLPLPQCHITKDPAHPRSRFLTHHLLAACYDFDNLVARVNQDTAVLEPANTTPETAGNSLFENRLACWEFLIDNGVTEGGSNGWRGELLPHVIRTTIFHPEQTWRVPFAKKVLELNTSFHVMLAASYEWVGQPAALDVAFQLGMDPANPNVVETACRYLNCSPNPREQPGARAETLRRILALVKPTNPIPETGAFLLLGVLDPKHPEFASLAELVSETYPGWEATVANGKQLLEDRQKYAVNPAADYQAWQSHHLQTRDALQPAGGAHRRATRDFTERYLKPISPSD